MIVRAVHFFIFKLKYSCKTNLISHLKAIFGTHCSTEPLVPGSHAIWMCEIFSPSGHLWYYRFNPVSQRHDGSSAVPSCTGAFFKPVDIVQKSFHTFHFWKQVVKLEYFYSGICCNFILGCHSFFFHPPQKKRITESFHVVGVLKLAYKCVPHTSVLSQLWVIMWDFRIGLAKWWSSTKGIPQTQRLIWHRSRIQIMGHTYIQPQCGPDKIHSLGLL